MKKIHKSRLFSTLQIMTLLGIFSCNEMILGDQPSVTPKSTFEFLWKEIDEKYSLFELKNLDWDEVYEEFSPQITNQMSDDELFDQFSNLLEKLDDGHVWMVKPNPGFRRYDSGPNYEEGTFDLDLIKSALTEIQIVGKMEEPILLYGMFENTDIGYLYLDHLGESPGFYEKHLETALAFFSKTEKLIIDARGIEGGDDRSAQVVASFFADATYPYMKTRFKTGPGHSDFGNWIYWSVKPAKTIYSKPMALLTDRGTGSAGETFTLAMRENPAMITVGNLTYGAFSDNPKVELPNGWIVALSTGDFRDKEGISYEGIGLEPDNLVINTPEDIQNNYDRILVRAISLLIQL